MTDRAYPASFERVTWRSVGPAVEGEMGLGFNRPDGSVIRVALPVEHAQCIHDALGEYLQAERSRGSSASTDEGGRGET